MWTQRQIYTQREDNVKTQGECHEERKGKEHLKLPEAGGELLNRPFLRVFRGPWP